MGAVERISGDEKWLLSKQKLWWLVSHQACGTLRIKMAHTREDGSRAWPEGKVVSVSPRVSLHLDSEPGAFKGKWWWAHRRGETAGMSLLSKSKEMWMKFWSAGCRCQVKFHKLQGGFSATKMPDIEEAALLKPACPFFRASRCSTRDAGSKPEMPIWACGPRRGPGTCVFSESSFQLLLEVEKGSFWDLLVWVQVKVRDWVVTSS